MRRFYSADFAALRAWLPAWYSQKMQRLLF